MINRFVPVALVLAVACGGGEGMPIVPPVGPPSDIGTMKIGEVRVFKPADIANGLDLPTNSSPTDYVIVVGNTNPQHDVLANYVVKADRLSGGSFDVANANNLGVGSSIALGGTLPITGAQQAMEMKVRAFERHALSLHSGLNPLGNPRFSVRRSVQVAAAAVPVPGDILNLKIPNAATTDLCNNFIRTQAVVASVGTHAILAVDTLDGPPLVLFSQADLDNLTAEFDNLTYPTELSYFGNPTDVDGNGHVIILFTGEVNRLTPAGQQGFVGGFFFAGDFFPTTGPPGFFCAGSNNAEIFYVLAPDTATPPKFGNRRTVSSVRQGTRGTIAHEFQHMINAGNRFNDPNQCCFESVWLDEALAHTAEDAVGRVQRGFSDLQTLTLNDLVPANNQAALDDFNAFFFQNLARLTFWMKAPDKFAPFSASADTSLAVRGAAWSVVRYALDNLSAGNPRALSRKLAAGPDTGTANFTASAKAPIDTIVAHWLVANYADHLPIPGLSAQDQFRSYNFRDVMPPVAKSVTGSPTPFYPLQVRVIGSGSDNIPATNSSGSGTYYRLTVPANSGPRNVKVLDPAGTLASFAGAHIYVLKVQ